MQFEYTDKVKTLIARLEAFFDEHIYPNEKAVAEFVMGREGKARWEPIPIVEALKPKARAAGLWNLFLPHSDNGAGLTNLEYAPLCEIMGRVGWSSEVFNCSAPDTGNMEILDRFASPANKERWLKPLLNGEIRSAFSMTEPAVASSDATNISTRIERDGDEYVINGRKWWSSGAGDTRCEILVVMGKSNPDAPKHQQQSQILVPMKTPGVKVIRHLPVFGFDDAPHGHSEIVFENVRVPADNILLGEGRGFEIAQARLGPGRIHHCMRNIGVAERTLEKTCKRLLSRVAFGKPIADQSIWLERIANCRIQIDQARLLVLNAADKMDRLGNKAARREIAMIKVAAPTMLNYVIDWAIQAHGAAGVTTDFGLGHIAASARTMRIVDGPDEVHRNQIGKLELAKYK
ncbi:MAG TPA: acyl-CoA dehydrogenase family protein [Povalibacter sp.]|uniref:acyl-CoA dehydrogenase family protein n=1 Tax=Povalibacter sp. TaxID=1962978 RepID=UPI002C39733A|nr:acyl-CoA dehydrogenase family protein [Povalibacter sp.]HMN44563.1 acyl-CoA dehydrogenase family protein [Povalibacter sp.]